MYDELVKFAPTLSTDKGDKSDTESSDYFSAGKFQSELGQHWKHIQISKVLV